MPSRVVIHLSSLLMVSFIGLAGCATDLPEEPSTGPGPGGKGDDSSDYSDWNDVSDGLRYIVQGYHRTEGGAQRFPLWNGSPGPIVPLDGIVAVSANCRDQLFVNDDDEVWCSPGGHEDAAFMLATYTFGNYDADYDYSIFEWDEIGRAKLFQAPGEERYFLDIR